jgi:DNA repair ATPase RecN
MKYIVITLISFMMLPASAQSQSLVVASDTSYLLFPNNAKISLRKMQSPAGATFQFDRKNFKALIFTSNYHLNNLAVTSANVNVLMKEQAIADSALKVMEKKYLGQKELVEFHRAEFENLKQVSSQYDTELKACTNDLAKLKNQKDKTKRISFIKGLLWGFAIGAVGGIVVGAAL